MCIRDRHNGYVRYFMWKYSLQIASQSIDSFLFGYGFSTDMFETIDNFFWQSLLTRSVDTYWMVNLLRFGWVMLFFHVFFIILIFVRNIKYGQKSSSSRHRRLNEAWLISAIGFTLIACTVHFWTSTVSFYMVILAALMTRPVSKNKKSNEKLKIVKESSEEIRQQILARK